jgi:hypothetical protein
LAGAVQAIRTEPARFHLPPIIEAHAALLADADPAAAATLLGLADAVRLKPIEALGRGRPGADRHADHYRRGVALCADGLVANLATLARVLGGSLAVGGGWRGSHRAAGKEQPRSPRT